MAHYVAPFAAVDIIDKQLVVLQLASARGRLWVHQWHQQPATQACSQKLHCRALMTVMDHRAVHYQQLSEHQQLHQVRESVHASLGLEHTQLDTLTLDYQHTPLGTQIVSGHCSQVRKKQQQFEVLKCPVSIVEPAFQAVIEQQTFCSRNTTVLPKVMLCRRSGKFCNWRSHYRRLSAVIWCGRSRH